MIREKKLVQLLKKRKDDEAWISFLKIKAENFGRRKKFVQVFFFFFPVQMKVFTYYEDCIFHGVIVMIINF